MTQRDPAAQASEKAEQALRVLIDEQAEDGALWAVHPFGEQPIVEAYLQQELRRLHVAVEAALPALAALSARLAAAETALAFIGEVAESWHGPSGDGGHERALAVIAETVRNWPAALASPDTQGDSK